MFAGACRTCYTEKEVLTATQVLVLNSSARQQAMADGRRERGSNMYDTSSCSKGYVLSAVLGAIGGGAIVAVATDAIPRMMSQMMSGMMQNMMAQMGEGEFDPSEV